MKTYTPTPDYYNDYICHFNKNHDPKNGQFTTGPGGSAGSIKKKEPKARKIWTYNQLYKDLKTGRRELTKEEYNRLTGRIADTYMEAIPGLAEWVQEHDPNLEKFDPLNPQDYIGLKRFREDNSKKYEALNKIRDEKDKIKNTANSNQDMFNDIMNRVILDGDKTAINDFTKEIERVAKENNIDAFELESVVNDNYNKYLGSKVSKAKIDFDGDSLNLKELGKYINGKRDIVGKDGKIKSYTNEALDKIKKEVESTEIKRETSKWKNSDGSSYDILEGNFGKENEKISIHGFSDGNVDEKVIKEVAQKTLSNKNEIKKVAMEAIAKDDVYEWWGKPLGISKQEFLNALDIKSVYIPNGKDSGNVEISVYEKNPNDNLLGGHSIDIEMDLNNLKNKPRYVSVNG